MVSKLFSPLSPEKTILEWIPPGKKRNVRLGIRNKDILIK
jgi:hypothetical protein